MTKVRDNVWSVIYKAPADRQIRYRYNRNNNLDTDEVLNDWRSVGVRQTGFSLADDVKKWRWLDHELLDSSMTFIVHVPENTPSTQST